MNIKKFLTGAMLTLIAVSAYAADPQVLSFSLLPKMTCSNCENKIKSNLRFEKGVKAINTSIANQRVDITFDPAKADSTSIIKAFKKIGYKATVIKK